jgi:hypothetical protein
MEVKIEGTPEELSDLQKFAHERGGDIIPDEEYAQSPGYNKEPLIIALIISLTPVSRLLIREFFKYRTEKLKAENKRHRIIENAKEDQIRLSLKEGRSWKYCTVEEVISMEVNDPSSSTTPKSGSDALIE